MKLLKSDRQATLSLPKRLSPSGLAILERRHAVVEKKSRASRVGLEQTLAKYGYPLSAGILAFEAAYGGLLVPEYGAKANWRKMEELAWLFGAHACLTSEIHLNSRGGSQDQGLVPVAYSPNDVIYFLDADGHGFVQDTIEDTQAVPFASRGRALISRILLWDEIFFLKSVVLTGALGNKLKSLLSLTLDKDASAKDVRFFVGHQLYVTETAATGETLAETVLACKTQKQLTSIQKLLADHDIAKIHPDKSVC